MNKNCWLCNSRLFKFISGSCEHDVSNFKFQNVISTVKKFFCNGVTIIDILSHTYELCSLTWKYISLHFLCFLIGKSTIYDLIRNEFVPLNKSRFQFRCRYHAMLFPTEEAIAVVCNDIVEYIAYKTWNNFENIKYGPET